MSPETKTCQNCKHPFTIEPEDFAFYEKMSVPPPTWCPLCRLRRVMLWRNERSLYRRRDALSGKDIISIWAPEKPLVVYDSKTWWSDAWNPLDYGQEYDFSKPFFVQFQELMRRIPLAALFNINAVNSDYCNHAEDSRNCYFLFEGIWNENVCYSKIIAHCKDSFDLYSADKSELTYENINCNECYRVSFSKNATACTDSAFLLDCRGCSNCFGCVNLRNKSYYFFNEPCTKEEYAKKLRAMDLGSFRAREEIKARVHAFQEPFPRRFAHLVNSPGSTGDILADCKDCVWCFDCFEGTENCRYMKNGGYGMKDSEVGHGAGVGDLMDEVVDTGIGTSRVFATVVLRNGHDVRYAFDCHGVHDLFGCIGIRNKSYCILNKQYSKEEYEALVPRIIKHMSEMPYTDAAGRVYRYGEFFPTDLSPFAYNETAAQEYFPLTKDEAITQGYAWRDPDARNYQITVTAEALPDHINDVSDAILKETIGCDHRGKCSCRCTTAFRVIPQELEFYRTMRLALPRLCPNCRHAQRLKQRNPLFLWHRACICGGSTSDNGAHANQAEHFHGADQCPNEFETSYAPDRPEIVYCEQCYQQELV